MDDIQEQVERNNPNFLKMRLPHGEWVWVERLTGFSTEGGTGKLLNEPVADCGLHWGSEVAFVVKETSDGSSYYELDWDGVIHSRETP